MQKPCPSVVGDAASLGGLEPEQVGVGRVVELVRLGLIRDKRRKSFLFEQSTDPVGCRREPSSVVTAQISAVGRDRLCFWNGES